MEKLIKKILKEEFEDDGFDWIRNIEVNTDLSPAQIKMRYDVFPVEVVGPSMSNFSDIYWEGKRLILRVNHWEDFSELFKDNDSSQYGYIDKSLAKVVLGEDDYWEPYYDVVHDWENQVWDLVTDNKELLDYIKNYIKEYFVIPNNYDPKQLDMFDGASKRKDVFEIDGRILDTDFFNEIITDDQYLGELVDDDPTFEDLKNELTWAYESAYNTAARDNVWKSAYGAIKDIFGEGEWISFENRRGYTGYKLKFDVTGLVLSTTEDSIENCLADCRRYFDPETHYDVDEDESVEKAFESFCEECEDWPFTEFGDFTSFYAHYLDENGDMLNPSFSELPNDKDVAEYFVEDVYGRIF